MMEWELKRYTGQTIGAERARQMQCDIDLGDECVNSTSGKIEHAEKGRSDDGDLGRSAREWDGA
jgi:hypothetical protein